MDRWLANITVSADSRGAMALGRTTRTAASAITTLRGSATPEKILHLTYWRVDDDEAAALYELVAATGVRIQLSPVTLTDKARDRIGLGMNDYLEQHRHDTDALGRYFALTPAFKNHLLDLRAMHLYTERRNTCRPSSLYVSHTGGIRRCPFSANDTTIHATRADIHHALTQPPTSRISPDCAALCRAEDKP
ncbi:hypothetical protein [Streptomyces sp. ISL-86]|uniref:hypothetical protein n=1 Tax=Streptomyces sp. ISL-86 TaxID=2819187 RepID=UPI002034B817|nr:hypothetical protein [Streptomyces sp. ISL-86]